MSKTATRLERLREQEAQLMARIGKLVAKEKQEAKKDEARLKFLVGAAVLADAAKHAQTGEFVRSILKRVVTEPRDQEFLAKKDWL